MKSHGVSAALNPFYKVLTGANSSEDKDIKALGQQCLLPVQIICTTFGEMVDLLPFLQGL